MDLKNIEIHSFKGLQSIALHNCGSINAIVGKNNSGKSSILHAIDMVGLAMTSGWGQFQHKLDVKDLFDDVGAFSISLQYKDDSRIEVTTDPGCGPRVLPKPGVEQKLNTILLSPGVDAGLLVRRHKTPENIMNQVVSRDYTSVNALEILFAIKFYSERNQRGFTLTIYQELINEIKRYFPDIEEVESDRTEKDIATLTYQEYGKRLDILYSGTGLKHFLDVLLKITISKANIVLLDEPEMGLHPDLQRQFIEYLKRISNENGVQFFLATHSPILLNYADTITYFRITNTKGERAITPVSKDAIHTLLSDLGIRPSDIFSNDICLLVEGTSDVVFFEHIIRTLYSDDFDNVAIGVIQYGGGAAEGIIPGSIEVSNIVPAQKYTYWIRDRDTKPADDPSTNATQFKNALDRSGVECHILSRREIEYYYPETVLVAAQQGDSEKEEAVIKILNGDQSVKFANAAKAADCDVCVPTGKHLRQLLCKHLLKKEDIDQEIRKIIETKLIPWKKEILGES